MKRFIKYIAIAILAAFAFSCEQNDDIEFVSGPVTEPLILTETATIALSKGELDAEVYTLIWDNADFGDIPTPITYNIETAASGTDFENPYLLGSSTKTFLNLTVQQLSEAAEAAGLTPDVEGSLDIRISAFLGTQQGTPTKMSSTPLVLTVIPFSNSTGFSVDCGEIDVFTKVEGQPVLYIVGNIQKYYGRTEWTPEEAIAMNYIGDGTTQLFEAYVKIGADDGFKFISDAAPWADLEGNYGLETAGDLNGEITNNGGSSDLKPGEEGFYYIRANIDDLTYQFVKMDWGIIGAATPGGWEAETAMEYNFEANVFTLNQNLTTQEMKFRSSNSSMAIFGEDQPWNINIGPNGEFNSPGNIAVTAGNYDIELCIGLRGTAKVGGL